MTTAVRVRHRLENNSDRDGEGRVEEYDGGEGGVLYLRHVSGFSRDIFE